MTDCNAFGKQITFTTELFGATSGAWMPGCFVLPLPLVPECLYLAPWMDVTAQVAAMPGADLAVGATATKACEFVDGTLNGWEHSVNTFQVEWDSFQYCLEDPLCFVAMGL